MQISVRNLSKTYKSKPRLFKVGGLFGVGDTNTALRDINIEIDRGECVGIIGKNGSGKSTLLKLLCGITAPTKGEVVIKGKISALLELGAGFNPEYTGISNIYLNGRLQGLSKKEIKKLIPQISEFADIGGYISKPVKAYSDGMFLRLAFACAVMLKPDILIIDEALAVGDFAFRQKCFSKIEAMKNSGVTVILVSHDIDCVRKLCTRTIWLDEGRLIKDGDTASVSAAYMEAMTGAAEAVIKHNPATEINSCLNRFGSATGSISSLTMPSTMQTNKDYTARCRLDLPHAAVKTGTALSFSIKNNLGLDLTVISTADYGLEFTQSGKSEVSISFTCRLCPGEYSLCVALEDRSQVPIKYYDYAEGVQTIQVFAETEYFGTFVTPAEIDFKYGVEQ